VSRLPGSRGEFLRQRVQWPQAASHRPTYQQRQHGQRDQRRQAVFDPQRRADVASTVVPFGGAYHHAIGGGRQRKETPAVFAEVQVLEAGMAGIGRRHRGEIAGHQQRPALAVEHLEAHLRLIGMAVQQQLLRRFGGNRHHYARLGGVTLQRGQADIADQRLQRAGRLRQASVGQLVHFVDGAPEAVDAQRQQHQRDDAKDQPA